MNDRRVKLGRAGEKIAEDYFKNAGYHILHRRYRGGRKEIDLVMPGFHTVSVQTQSVHTAAEGKALQAKPDKKTEQFVIPCRLGRHNFLLDHTAFFQQEDHGDPPKQPAV